MNHISKVIDAAKKNGMKVNWVRRCYELTKMLHSINVRQRKIQEDKNINA